MRNASPSPRPQRRPFTNRLAVAALLATGLLTGILTAVVPATGAMATEAAPTAGASASATATKAAEKAEVVSVGAGMLVAHTDANIQVIDGTASIGSLAAGEQVKWTTLDTRSTPALYSITTDLGLEGTVSEMQVTALPQDGIKLDRPVMVKEATGRDVLSGFGGKLDSSTMVLASAPSRGAEVLQKLQVGKKFQASALIKGEETLFGTSMWAVVLTDPDTKEYAFIRSEALEKDAHPEEPEVLEATPTDTDDDEQSESTAFATDSETAAVTASAVAVVPATEAPRPGTVDAEGAGDEKKDDSSLLVAGGLGALVLVVGGLTVAGKRKNKKAAATDDVDDAKPAKKVVEVDADEDSETDVAVEAAAEPEAEDIDWDAED